MLIKFNITKIRFFNKILLIIQLVNKKFNKFSKIIIIKHKFHQQKIKYNKKIFKKIRITNINNYYFNNNNNNNKIIRIL